MKKLALLTAVLLGSALTPAAACDWDRNASTENHTIVACAGGTCVGQPQTTQQEPAAQEPAAPQAAVEPADPIPTTVADGSGNRGDN
jgi:hypothetical protein